MRLLRVFGIVGVFAILAVASLLGRLACASDDSISRLSGRGILPPLGSAIEILPAPNRGATQPAQASAADILSAPEGDGPQPVLAKAVETAKPQDGSSDQVPAADTPSLEDDVSDSVAENAVVPQVEEDSEAGLNDLGDDGGDFEE